MSPKPETGDHEASPRCLEENADPPVRKRHRFSADDRGSLFAQVARSVRTEWSRMAMQRNRFLALLSWLILAPLAGCAHDVPTTVDVTGMPNPEIAMRESIAHVDSEMAELGRMRPVPREVPPVVPAELDKVVAFAWEGPLDGAVEKPAGVIGYTVAVAAPANAVPLPIGIRTGPQRVS